MAGLFDLKPRSSKESDAKIAAKSSKKMQQAAITVKGGGSLMQRINTIKALVDKHLGKYKEEYLLIRDEASLVAYFDQVIKDGIVAIDTETNSLDPITTTLAGISLYSPSNKAVYIPINHISYVTGIKAPDQLSCEFVKDQMLRLVEANTKIIMFNAKFDMRVLKHQLALVPPGQNVINGDYILKASYDGYLAAKILNENETSNGLKSLHNKYILDGKGDAFAFDDLFKGIPFTHVPITTGYLYAAHDAKITFDLYEYQQKYLDMDNPECQERGLEGIAHVFHNIEMPIIDVVAKMEDCGVAVDFEYLDKLEVKYKGLLEEKSQAFHLICDDYSKEIKDFRKVNPGTKLDSPITISSPQQIATLLFDILGLTGNKKAPRSTKEDDIKHIEHPIVKALLAYREINKLYTTYINNIPNIINPITKRIHCSFNQYGAVTGRFSSSEPNMQNIPAHNKDIRPMYIASEGYVMMSSDYSKQEPAITSHMSQDEAMIQAFIEGKDIYSQIASLAFNVPYLECCEKRQDGTKYPIGEERRQKAKAIVLGICYGKQIKSIAEDLGVETKKAQEIYDNVMKAFPKLKEFMEDSQNMARELGFVETAYGRKRRLPEMQLEQYEFSWIGGVSGNFDPTDFEEEEEELDPEVPYAIKERYIKQLNKAFGFKAKKVITDQAKAENIKIVDNSGYIAQATRQCVNSRIQGSAADLTKLAMQTVGHDPILKELGFRLMLQVHDELIGECPFENRHEVAKRFSELMVHAAKDLSVPLTCDVEITQRWYGEKIT